jgi:hypothetical protein
LKEGKKKERKKKRKEKVLGPLCPWPYYNKNYFILFRYAIMPLFPQLETQHLNVNQLFGHVLHEL